MGGSWVSMSGQTLSTLRVKDDGSVWGFGVSDWVNPNDGSIQSKIYYRNPSNTAWTTIYGAAVTFGVQQPFL